MSRLHTLPRAVAGVTGLWTLIAAIGCTRQQPIQTLRPGVFTVAVTPRAPTNQYDLQLWIREYVEQFAAEHKPTISWVVIPFNE